MKLALAKYSQGSDTVSIYQDDDYQESPRDWCNIGTLSLVQKYSTASNDNDDTVCNNEHELIEQLIDDEDNYSDYDEENEEYILNEEKAWSYIYEHYIILPVYVYDHSGVTFSTKPFSCVWDSGQAGFIWVKKSDIKKLFNVTEIEHELERCVKKDLKAELETYNQFINGDIYYYEVENKDGDITELCGGFYGGNHKDSGLFESAGIDDNAIELI